MLVLLIQTPHWSVLTASTFLTCYSLLKLVQVVYLLKLLLEDLSDSYLCPDAVVSSPTSCCFDFSAALGADEHSSWKTFFFPCFPWYHSLLVFLRPQRSLLISFAGSSSSSARPLNMPRGWALAFFFSMTFLEAVSPIPEALNSVYMRDTLRFMLPALTALSCRLVSSSYSTSSYDCWVCISNSISELTHLKQTLYCLPSTTPTPPQDSF